MVSLAKIVISILTRQEWRDASLQKKLVAAVAAA
jgi:hypothetical protein